MLQILLIVSSKLSFLVEELLCNEVSILLKISVYLQTRPIRLLYKRAYSYEKFNRNIWDIFAFN